MTDFLKIGSFFVVIGLGFIVYEAYRIRPKNIVPKWPYCDELVFNVGEYYTPYGGEYFAQLFELFGSQQEIMCIETKSVIAKRDSTNFKRVFVEVNPKYNPGQISGAYFNGVKKSPQ